LELKISGIYNASKAAVHMLDENLRTELAPFGVGVLTVVVGAIETGFQENNRSADLPQSSRYHAVKGNIDAIAGWKTGETRTKAADFAKMVVDDVLGGKVGMTYRGSQASIARYASALMPISMLVSWPENDILIRY
jgi:1-acylglycerone phosphate reductase